MEKYCIATGHEVQFDLTTMLSKASGLWDRVIMESIEIRLDPTTVNQEAKLKLSVAWSQL